MKLSVEERETLVSLEIKKAHETFEEIEILANANRWSGAANRLYYAVFHAVSALLIHDGFAISTHKGSHAMFHLHYVKSGIFDIEYGRLYSQLQTMREQSDYNCVYEISSDELRERIEPAKKLIALIEDRIRQVTP